MAQSPFDILTETSSAYIVSRCVNSVAELGIADALGDAPRTPAELAAATETNAGALGRVLRLLSSYGIFEARDGGYSHTPASRFLRADHPQSLRGYVLMCNLAMCWRSFEALSYSLRTGQPALEEAFPGGMWSYLASRPEEARIFNEAMTGKSQGPIAGIISLYDFSPFGAIADIGGGHGHLLQAVLAAAHKAKGILFDQPIVIQEAAGIASDRLKLQTGDFFKDALPVADAYLIMQVIHDWSDEEATKILRGIRRAAPPHAKLLVIEAVIPDTPAPDWAKMVDLFMLALLTGRERTRSEYQKLLAGAGFRLDRVIDVGQSTAILEAVLV
jgi:O-methyltransferase domain